MNSTPAEQIVDDKPTSVADTLRRARALIGRRNNWTKQAFARTTRSYIVTSRDVEAVRWCALGAIERVDGPFENDATVALTRAIGTGVVRFNDNPKTKHSDVLAAFDRAIALAESGS